MKIVQRIGRGNLSRLCILSGHSRQAYYKAGHRNQDKLLKEELIVQKIIDYRQVQPKVGGCKLQVLLKPFFEKQEIKMGRDLLFELLRSYSLLVIKRRRNKPRTTFSNHWQRKYPNLVAKLTPRRSGGVWVSDITYIELCQGHGYLSLVTDAYSRKIVGYHLHEQLNAVGPVTALQMAVAGCDDRTGLIHHSDRGSQYCSNEYVGILQKEQIGISMTENSDPRENAIAERVNGILKTELLKETYPDISTARTAIARAVNIYNYLRPHSSINMLTPALAHRRSGELKRRWKNSNKAKPAAIMDSYPLKWAVF